MKHYFKNNTCVAVILVLLVSVIWVNFNLARWNKKEVIEWDITNYYTYLPAVFIQHDLKLSFFDKNKDEYLNKHMYVPETAPNGNYVIKATMGMSLMYLPFFMAAHTAAHFWGYETNGFSEPYHFMIQFSGLFYVIVGLYYLRKILRLYFSENISAFALLCVIFGTNLFYYVSIAGAMPHAVGFFLTTAFMYFTIKWHNHPSIKQSVILGCLFGLMVLIRPVNFLIILFFIFFKIEGKTTFKNKLLFYTKSYRHILLIGLFAFLCIIPQLIYWKYTTGQFIFFSYVGERFYFNNPHLTEGFVSFRKGWLLYTPLMTFSVIGFLFLRGKLKPFLISVVFIFIIYVYILFSWWCWWYGGSFGQRGMIDIYPLLTISLAAFIMYVSNLNKIKLRLGFTVMVILILFNIFQTLQYKWGIIHFDGMTKEAYFDSFFRINPNPEFNTLIKRPDYEKALLGEGD